MTRGPVTLVLLCILIVYLVTTLIISFNRGDEPTCEEIIGVILFAGLIDLAWRSLPQ